MKPRSNSSCSEILGVSLSGMALGVMDATNGMRIPRWKAGSIRTEARLGAERWPTILFRCRTTYSACQILSEGIWHMIAHRTMGFPLSLISVWGRRLKSTGSRWSMSTLDLALRGNDGIFWMSIEDWAQLYTKFQPAQLHWRYTNASPKHGAKSMVLLIRFDPSQSTSINISQL